MVYCVLEEMNGRSQQMKVSNISEIRYWKELAMQKEDNGISQQGLHYKPLGKDADIFKQKEVGR
jgi:hypothetical protein